MPTYSTLPGFDDETEDSVPHRRDAATELPRVASLTVDETGTAALDIARAWGWHPSSPLANFTLRGDVLKSDRFALSRYEMSAAEFRYIVPSVFGRKTARLLMACLSGEIEVDVGGSTVRLTPGKLLFANPEDVIAKRCTGQVSNLMVIFPRPQPVVDNYVGAAMAPNPYLRVLIDASASILRGGVRPDSVAFTRVGLGVEALIWALATETPLTPLSRSGTEMAHIYSDAVKYVALHAGDPATTVYSITRTLRVSRSQLYRAFAATGDTPSNYLRNARVRLAQNLLASRVAPDLAARSSGFETVRRMRRALSGTAAPEPFDDEPEVVRSPE